MQFSRKSQLALSVLALYAVPTSAQGPAVGPGAAAGGAGGPPSLSSAEAAQSSSAAAKSSKSDSTQTDSKTAGKTGSTSIQSTTASITGSDSSAPTATGAIPTITGGSTATTGGGLPTGLPTITGGYRIIAPSVPPTSGDGWSAPYLQVSSLPDGTVFIIVGAILGFLALSVLLWRSLVAWSLHRSVKRAAAAQYSDIKSTLRAPAPFYKYSDRESTLSLGAMGMKNSKKNRQSAMPGEARSSLFFSPTAGVAGAGGPNAPGNRGSSYLPAGYYAAGASQPENGQGMAHIGQSISLSNLGPARDGYSRARSVATTPPDSPAARPNGGIHGHQYGASRSTLNLNDGGSARAPSAYLDDLFGADGGPPVPGHGRNKSLPQRP